MQTGLQRDDTYLVDHLDQDGHVVWCLKDLEVVVVAAGQPRHAHRYATLPEVTILVAAGVETLNARDSTDIGAPLALRCPGREPAIRGIDDQRGLRGRPASRIPETVVAAGAPLRGRAVDLTPGEAGLQRGHFLVGENLSLAQLTGSFQGCRDNVRPDPPKVRSAVRRTGWRPIRRVWAGVGLRR